MSGFGGGGDFMAGVLARVHAKTEGKKPKAPPKTSDSAWQTAMAETAESMQEDDWSLMCPRHWVALYAILHRHVYGIAPAELTPTARTRAAAAAKRLLDREFGSDRALMAAWFRWAWDRERGRHQWRAREGRPASRLGWGFFFGGALVTDWRLETAGKPPR